MSSLLQNLPSFIVATALLVMIPGQGVAMVLRQSIIGGPRAAFLSSIGNCAGILIWSISSAIGLSAIFAQSNLAYSILKWTGVIFLTGISIQTFLSLRKEFGKFDLESEVLTTAWGSFRLGLVTNLTNAKAAVYAVAFIPAFIPQETSLAFGIVVLGTTWALISIVWNIGLIWTVKKSSTYIQRPQVRRALTAVSAIGILAIAGGLALS
ncbi:MAG: LysE family translocator [Candidatus Planktophila sp.]|nr:LysE family translocator [Candidatus Planktophila sp.]